MINKVHQPSKRMSTSITSKTFSATKTPTAIKIKPKMILIEGVKKQGIGYAIMNRLLRTCEHNYFEK